MFKRKELKQKSRKILRKNYWVAISVCLLSLLFGGDYQQENINFNVFNRESYIDINNSNFDITDEILKSVLDNDNIEEINVFPEVTDGVFRIVFNVVTQFERTIFKILKSILNIVSPTRAGIFIGITIYVITSLYTIFIAEPLLVGEKRFFLEMRLYPKTKFNRMFCCFHRGKYWNIVKACLRKNIYQFLWDLTIIGGIIKHYSYRLVSYLLAENPNLSSKEAILLSRKMMQGYKWDVFKLDMSFLGWQLLNACTFGLTGILYSRPYQETVNVEMYDYIKRKQNAFPMDENLLENKENLDAYPGIKARKKFDASQKFNYYKRYSLSSMILFFFCFAIVGFLWEVGLHFVQYGNWVKRGVFMGPWLPIYGFGCVLVLLLLYPKKLKKITDNPIITFFLIMFLCTTMEYITSWYLEITKGTRWWDYTGFFLNINGRVCLEGALFFAIGGTACIYIFTPLLEKLFSKIPQKMRILLCIILVTIFAYDFVYSHFHPNMGSGITAYEEVEEIIRI